MRFARCDGLSWNSYSLLRIQEEISRGLIVLTEVRLIDVPVFVLHREHGGNRRCLKRLADNMKRPIEGIYANSRNGVRGSLGGIKHGPCCTDRASHSVRFESIACSRLCGRTRAGLPAIHPSAVTPRADGFHEDANLVSFSLSENFDAPADKAAW